MKKLVAVIFGALIVQTPFFSQEQAGDSSVQFEFKYKKNDRYRILSTVNEDVFINGEKSHHALIVNRVTARVTETDETGGGITECTFMTTEDSTGSRTGAKFSYGEEYKSVFHRTKNGIYTISDEYFMPTVRDVPVFPDKKLSPGDKWTARGHEAHDLRRIFGLETPYKVPFIAEYEYIGKEEEGNLHVFKVKYNMKMRVPQNQIPQTEDYPVAMNGFSDETVFWDLEKGAIDHYSENFRIIMETATGAVLEFSGTAQAEVTEFERTATEENLSAVQKKVSDMGIQNVTVSKGEKGLTLSLEDIKFQADSAELLDSEKMKLEQIAQILEAWPENDILVTGHTALAGTAKMRQELSEQRARAVADYMILLGVRDRFHIFTQGFGATRPVAPNTTEEGKARNRRVEITIMDN
mgnify:FL=1